MRAVHALRVRKGASRAHRVPAVVEIEEIVEEVMRAMAWEALLEESVVIGLEAARVAERVKLGFVVVVVAMAHDERPFHSVEQRKPRAQVQAARWRRSQPRVARQTMRG